MIWTALPFLLLAGCEDDDTLLTGFSGLVIVCLVAYFLIRRMSRR